MVKIKIYKISFIILLFLLCFLSVNLIKAEEQNKENIWMDDLGKVMNETEYDPGVSGTGTELLDIIAVYIKLFLSLLGIIFLILIMYAGYLWMMAGGNEDQVAKSKAIIKNSFIGLGIALAAYATTYYIVERSVKVTQEKQGGKSGIYIKGMND